MAATGLLLLVGLSRPNAAQPDLLPRGWAPGPLLPVTLGPATVTAVLAAAYLLGAAGVLVGLRRGARALRGWWGAGGLALGALLVAPFGSADHISYVAYGRILVMGGNPWVASPQTWAGGSDPVTSRVEAPWTEEPSVYGPAATLLHGLSAALGGPQLRQEVWVWQLLVVLAWLATRAALRAALPQRLHGRVDVAWTTNPLVLGVGVLGAHVDVVAAAFVAAGVALLARRPGPTGGLLAGAVLGLAASTKVTYGVGLLAVVGGVWLARRAPREAVARTVGLVAGSVLVAGALHAWAGPHVYDQLRRSRDAVSLATPWRPLFEALRGDLGEDQARSLVTLGAAVVAVVMAAALARATRPAAPQEEAGNRPAVLALWLVAVLALAYSLAAPYSLPWYDVLVWSALPALVPGTVDLLALARLAVMALAYVPGRVLGMTPAVEAASMGFRREVAPWLVLLLWVVTLGVSAAGARGGSGRWFGPPRAGSPPTPTR
ncbi:DUF2029 domain-containing protein [Phycicoccus endophyticus]|uniref:DUF2029 domain-containing protein n=1 Tax=Phycicoccus endophyticus TaxID=1690220 RepID=A0A7G9R185_9MICO|nr:glycosyltransferase 87 family protein [Phycicoccus endophyticus]NHI18869.1 DUF2029 domain-containing protein [Phycicoccus endophyticus]QNN49360.1 DUF2029 domain-containing protein [Phycicoccus endophyticus]GGL35934.1 hypothetical protein GCM10012283_17900 [Phycicoccus endophyticus]